MALLAPTPYAVLADLQTYGLSQAAIGATPVATQQKLLDAANAKVDSYLASKFVLPLVSWSPDLVQCAAEIAAFSVIKYRGFDPEDPSDRIFQARADAQIAWLLLITKNELTVTVVDSAPGGTGGAGGIGYTSQVTTNSTGRAQPTLGGQATLNDVSQSGGQIFVGSPRLRGWS